MSQTGEWTSACKLDAQQMRFAAAAESWWLQLEPEQRKGYLEAIERHLERTYPSRAASDA